MTHIDLDSIYELDKQTLSLDQKKSFLADLENEGVTYVPYFDRIGPGLSTIASEIKREVDYSITQHMAEALGSLTKKRFMNVYSDVRVYPRGRELDVWKKNGFWNGSDLFVLVSFVLAIPPDDSLDTLIRLELVSMFGSDPFSSSIKSFKRKHKPQKFLNIDKISMLVGECNTDDFQPKKHRSLELEIIIDGCSKADFSINSDSAKGPSIFKKRSQTKIFDGQVPEVTGENAVTTVPILICCIAKALGIEHLNPKSLKRSDSLFALMGYDNILTLSLRASFTLHFDIMIGSLDTERLLTVGNCIDFVAIFLADFKDDGWDEDD